MRPVRPTRVELHLIIRCGSLGGGGRDLSPFLLVSDGSNIANRIFWYNILLLTTVYPKQTSVSTPTEYYA